MTHVLAGQGWTSARPGNHEEQSDLGQQQRQVANAGLLKEGIATVRHCAWQLLADARRRAQIEQRGLLVCALARYICATQKALQQPIRDPQTPVKAHHCCSQ